MKRILAMLTAAALLLCSPALFVYAEGGYVIGDDGYVPRSDGYATREEAVAAFVQAVGLDAKTADVSALEQFRDAREIAAAHTREVAAAVAGHLVTGYTDGTFRPQRPITRGEALVILARALADRSLPAVTQAAFTDMPDWAQAEIGRLANAGVVQGYGNGWLGAADPLTLEQVSVLTQRTVRLLGPAGDFYEYVNQDWLETAVLPQDQLSWSSADEVSHRVMKQLGEIIYSVYRQQRQERFPQGSSEQRIADLFYAAGNSAFRDRLGLEPAREYLALIDQAGDLPALIQVMGDLEYNGFHGLLPVSVGPDLRDSSRCILSLTACYTGPDSCRLQGETAQTAQDAYRAYLAGLFALFGQEAETAAQKADGVANLCRTLAAAAQPPTASTAGALSFHVYPTAETPLTSLNLADYLGRLGLGDAAEIAIDDPGQAAVINQLFQPENLELLKDYLRATVMDGSALYLDTQAFLLWRDYQDTLAGEASGALPGDYAIDMVEELLGWDLAKLYTQRYVSQEAITETEAMALRILEAFQARLRQNTWLSEATKAEAAAKIGSIRIQVGYPKDLERYLDPGYPIASAQEGGTLLGYRAGYCRRYYDNCAARMQEGVLQADRTAWTMLPQTVNAMYDLSTNSITIPAGILAPPFYDADASYGANLGGIGTVIAHEASHALDAVGSRFDSTGSLRDWWQAEDKAAFDALCGRVTEEYSRIEALDGMTVDGALTLGENLADLSGMACVLDVAEADGVNLEELFIAYAKSWRQKAEDSYLRAALQTDVHAPDKVRVNRVLSNFDAFQQYYDLREGDGMYLPQERRIQVWNRRN